MSTLIEATWKTKGTRHECHPPPDPQFRPVVITILTWKFFVLRDFEKWGQTYERTDTMCKNSDHYQPWLWAGLMDQFEQAVLVRGGFCPRCFCPGGFVWATLKIYIARPIFEHFITARKLFSMALALSSQFSGWKELNFSHSTPFMSITMGKVKITPKFFEKIWWKKWALPNSLYASLLAFHDLHSWPYKIGNHLSSLRRK